MCGQRVFDQLARGRFIDCIDCSAAMAHSWLRACVTNCIVWFNVVDDFAPEP